MTYFAIKDPTIVDIECFPNFFMVAFCNLRTGRVIVCKITDMALAAQIMRTHTTISFNGNKYDLPMLAAAIQGYTESQLKELSDQLIQSGVPHWKICRERGIEIPYEWDHVDSIEVAPGVMTSLKIYGGRMHSQRLQDLPYPHDSLLSDEQKQVVVDYCGNDLITTEELYQQLLPQIELRQSMSDKYEIDLRSKSDSQVAEGVIKREALRMAAKVVKKVAIPPGTKLRYTDPGFLRFESAELNQLLQRVLATEFELGENGAPLVPEWMKLFTVGIGSARYKLGIGGLHSQETCQLSLADKDHMLSDWDVASFYPNIILQQRMFPPGVGETFLDIYQDIVNRRIAAKRSGDKVVADSLKITLNGTFGKLGSHYSFLYAPHLLIQVTLTGQFALLMLIEKLHAAGIECRSANTDGIVLRTPVTHTLALSEITDDWMKATSYELECTAYKLHAARDVNNYIAITRDGKVKGKGIFTATGLMKNPDREIVYEAVKAHVTHGVDIEAHIRGCTDIRKFLTVRTVNGGAQWANEYLGKAIRFYHSRVVPKDMCITYVKNGYKVASSDGCRPMMQMFPSLPDDVDYDYYIGAAKALLLEIGYF